MPLTIVDREPWEAPVYEGRLRGFLGQVLPRPAIGGMANRPQSDSKVSGDGSAAFSIHAAKSGIQNGFSRKFCRSVAVASGNRLWVLRPPMAILRHSIPVIVAFGAYNQMASTATRRVIAFMEHTQAFRDWAYLKFVRNSVGTVMAMIEPHDSITIGGRSSYPHPTPAQLWITIGERTIFVDLLPKPVFRWPSSMGRIARRRAILSNILLSIRCRKLSVAMGACADRARWDKLRLRHGPTSLMPLPGRLPRRGGSFILPLRAL